MAHQRNVQVNLINFFSFSGIIPSAWCNKLIGLLVHSIFAKIQSDTHLEIDKRAEEEQCIHIRPRNRSFVMTAAVHTLTSWDSLSILLMTKSDLCLCVIQNHWDRLPAETRKIM